MALIQCPHCGFQISDKEKECPQCGKKMKKLPFVYHVIFVILVITVGVLTYILWDSKSGEVDTTETIAVDSLTVNQNL